MNDASERRAAEAGDHASRMPAERHPESNPFSASFVRPGALAFVFPPGIDADQVVDRLGASGWTGQILGPHGSGKSTLLAALVPVLQRRGRRPVLVTLHDGERSLAGHRDALSALGSDSVLIVDGYEQLAPWNKWRLRRLCRKRRCGLLITAHADLGFPTVYDTAVDEATALAVLGQLVRPEGRVGADDMRTALARQGGNLREALFELYDLYEQRRPPRG